MVTPHAHDATDRDRLLALLALHVVDVSRVRLSGRAVVSVLKESLSYGKTPIDSC
jgi:hypothetical protein